MSGVIVFLYATSLSILRHGSKCHRASEQVCVREPQFPGELIPYLADNYNYSLCLLGCCWAEGFSNLSKRGFDFYTWGLHFGDAAMTDTFVQPCGIRFGTHFSRDDLTCKASHFQRRSEIWSFSTVGYFPLSCFDCTVWLFGGICGSESKENAVPQQVTKSYYALFYSEHYYHFPDSTGWKKWVTLVLALYLCEAYFWPMK